MGRGQKNMSKEQEDEIVNDQAAIRGVPSSKKFEKTLTSVRGRCITLADGKANKKTA